MKWFHSTFTDREIENFESYAGDDYAPVLWEPEELIIRTIAAKAGFKLSFTTADEKGTRRYVLVSDS